MFVCWIAFTGCTEPGPEHPRSDEPKPGPAIRVVVDDEAARAAARIGIDLDGAVADALHVVRRQIDLPVTTISVVVRPEEVIPEVGIGGETDHLGDVHLYVDPNRDDFFGALRVWLEPMLAHEAHHAARTVDGPGYGDSLVEAIVSEGLADVYSEEGFPDTPALPWTQALERSEICPWWRRAVRDRGAYDHDAWFFGTGRPPRWTGYALGYTLVRRYLRTQATTAADSVRTTARAVVSGADFCRS